MNIRPKTIFCDIDGTLVKHNIPTENTGPLKTLHLLPNTLKKLSEWDAKGYNIILTTGRRESMRKATEEQLAELGILYDQLIMGIGGGDRILVNDCKPDGRETAFAFNLKRDEGIGKLDI